MSTPPHKMMSERLLLGALFAYPERIPDVAAQLEPTEFFNLKYQAVYRAMTDLLRYDKVIDAGSVHQWLNEKGNPGGANVETIGTLFAEGGIDTQIDIHVMQVKQMAALRSVIKTAEVIAEQGYRLTDGVPEFLATSLEMMIRESSANVTGEPMPIGDGITDMITQAMDPHPVRDVRIPTGIQMLDNAVGGLLNEQMNMIVGRPDSGKTTVISEIALGLATRGPVLWFSLEETVQQLQFILTSKLCGIPYHNLQMGRQTAKEIVQAASWVAELPITVERQRLKTDAILQRCMAFKGRVKNVAGVIIDHAALIPIKDSGEFRGMYNMFTDLSAIPGRIGCPLVVAHQLNRKAHGRRPEMYDLRDAGEEPAKMIVGLYRDCVYNQEADPRKMELIVMKNKGPKGTIELDIDVTCARFL